MKRAAAYLIILLATYCSIGIFVMLNKITVPNDTMKTTIYCGLIGGIGGITYCLRGIYLNASVFKQWDKIWLSWYFLRPLVSVICGVISWLFLRAGLFVLEAQQTGSSTNLGFYALAFVAGLNVDKFIEKIEDIAQVTWGIKKSRTAQKDENNG